MIVHGGGGGGWVGVHITTWTMDWDDSYVSVELSDSCNWTDLLFESYHARKSTDWINYFKQVQLAQLFESGYSQFVSQ